MEGRKGKGRAAVAVAAAMIDGRRGLMRGGWGKGFLCDMMREKSRRVGHIPVGFLFPLFLVRQSFPVSMVWFLRMASVVVSS
jgi:hypothetical protein